MGIGYVFATLFSGKNLTYLWVLTTHFRCVLWYCTQLYVSLLKKSSLRGGCLEWWELTQQAQEQHQQAFNYDHGLLFRTLADDSVKWCARVYESNSSRARKSENSACMLTVVGASECVKLKLVCCHCVEQLLNNYKLIILFYFFRMSNRWGTRTEDSRWIRTKDKLVSSMFEYWLMMINELASIQGCPHTTRS